MLWFTLVAVFIVYIVLKIYDCVSFWQRKGITYAKPWPLIGNLGENLFRKITWAEQLQKLYNKYPEAKFFGFHQLTKPILMVRDPEVIKQVTVKNFDNFSDHSVFLTDEVDPIFGKSIFSLQGQRWRNMRSTLSPAFTSSKMRKMYILIEECAKQFTQHFLQIENENGILQVEMKDVFTKYTNDVIASTAFGITCNSLKDDKNEFYVIGKKITNFGFLSSLKILAFIVIPSIMKALRCRLFSKNVTDFFCEIIQTTIKIREKNNIIRPDMIHLLMEARKGRLNHDKENDEDAGFATVEESQVGKKNKNVKTLLTDDDITAQAFLFFIAGYDTSSTMMCFMAHELAVNPEIQTKLQEEIDTTFEKCHGYIDYDSLLKIKYLDMVVCESLRKWPPAPQSERICTQPITLEGENEAIKLEEHQVVWMPVYCLHHDQKYFQDPEKFDPERFSDENKNNIVPFTYLPFGAGPRNCIGSRFALLEIKILFIHLLSKFDIVVIKKTQVPLKLTKDQFAMKAKNGFWLGFKHRN